MPLNDYSRQTYVSENAILPGQVHTYFGGSEHNVFRAFRQEVYHLSQQEDEARLAGLQEMMEEMGLKSARQTYSWQVVGEEVKGTNVYGMLTGPRADATEAMVLIAAWRNFEGKINYSGVALALSLMRYFKRWSVWSKDILLLIPEDSVYGPEAWVSAYHSTAPYTTASRNISSLPVKAGALQGAVALDYPAGPWGQRFDKIDIVYDGINGALPNLDLLNTAVAVASSQHGIGCTLHGLADHKDTYADRLTTISRGLLTQSAGHATGPHSAFMPYHVDAITLKTVGDGWHDEMSLGRTTESLMRSINNLLEHLHQSFFFYILLNTHRFVSIGNYLPAAMILAGGFTITALALWVQSGRVERKEGEKEEVERKLGKVREQPRKQLEVVKEGGDVALVPKIAVESRERKMFLPVAVLLGVHLAGLIPLYLLNHLPYTVSPSFQCTYSQTTSLLTHSKMLPATLATTTLLTLALPIQLSLTLAPNLLPQDLTLLHALSLLLLGATLSTLATLNFSLAFLLALLTSPQSFLRPLPSLTTAWKTKDDLNEFLRRVVVVLPVTACYAAICPPVLCYAVQGLLGWSVEGLLREMARGWVGQGVWTGLVVWGVWWPAWVVGGVVLGCRVFRREGGRGS